MSGLTYTPGDLAKTPNTVAKRAALASKAAEDFSSVRDRVWSTLRKLVASGASDKALDRAARNLNG